MKRRYEQVRGFTTSLCESLQIEDYQIQTMPDVSPTKWHLAHTTWFFETFVVKPTTRDWEQRPHYDVLFNSYYNAVGQQWTRAHRGLLSRPTVAEVYAYRDRVDEAVCDLLDRGDVDLAVVELGLHHEQQHQELLLTDIKHVLGFSPLRPVFRADAATPSNGAVRARGWRRFDEGLRTVGFVGDEFAFDNEGPAHRVFLDAFEIADRLVTNAEWIEFIDDGGYSTPSLWLSEGWNLVNHEGWQAPMYWERRDDGWSAFTLGGERVVDPAAAVTHISLFEADAFATWAGARLPTEHEWEAAAAAADPAGDGNFVESRRLHPGPGRSDQFFGDVWEWTRSAYAPYPGYQPAAGALGEYNGKFMANQNVLRGGSCATSVAHIRPTYRNFFPAHARWQFSGVRLCR